MDLRLGFILLFASSFGVLKATILASKEGDVSRVNAPGVETCVLSCVGLEKTGCLISVSCENKCPGGLVWNSQKQRCEWATSGVKRDMEALGAKEDPDKCVAKCFSVAPHNVCYTRVTCDEPCVCPGLLTRNVLDEPCSWMSPSLKGDVLTISADDIMGTLYFDGKQVPLKGNADFRTGVSYDLPLGVRVIAVSATDLEGGFWITASSARGFMTDGDNWRCTRGRWRLLESGWQNPNFDDSTWPIAQVLGNNGNHAKGVSASAGRIWAAGQRHGSVFCRGFYNK